MGFKCDEWGWPEWFFPKVSSSCSSQHFLASLSTMNEHHPGRAMSRKMHERWTRCQKMKNEKLFSLYSLPMLLLLLCCVFFHCDFSGFYILLWVACSCIFLCFSADTHWMYACRDRRHLGNWRKPSLVQLMHIHDSVEAAMSREAGKLFWALFLSLSRCVFRGFSWRGIVV